jgi:hypothetical protein
MIKWFLTRRMLMKNRGKGAEFERTICKELSKWVSNGERDDIFWRSSMSGGRHTVRKKAGLHALSQTGDICAVHPDGHWLLEKFSIECKYYAKLDIDSVIFGRAEKFKLLKFWEQCKRDCTSLKEPLLICKQNYQNPIILTTDNSAALMFSDAGIRAVAEFPRMNAVVYLWEDFMKIPYSKFKENN